MSGLARSHTGRGTDPGLFLGIRVLNSWILMISKPPSHLHVVPQDTKPYGMTVAELANSFVAYFVPTFTESPSLASLSSPAARAAEEQQR